jgi:hypothetical protein
VQLSVNKYHCHCQKCPWDANASVWSMQAWC